MTMLNAPGLRARRCFDLDEWISGGVTAPSPRRHHSKGARHHFEARSVSCRTLSRPTGGARVPATQAQAYRRGPCAQAPGGPICQAAPAVRWRVAGRYARRQHRPAVVVPAMASTQPMNRRRSGVVEWCEATMPLGSRYVELDRRREAGHGVELPSEVVARREVVDLGLPGEDGLPVVLPRSDVSVLRHLEPVLSRGSIGPVGHDVFCSR